MTYIYRPDSWQVVHVIPKDTGADYYRILAGWSGGFAYGSSWKLSSGFGAIRYRTSGCKQVIREGDYWRVPQSSGSVYILHKNSERYSTSTYGVLEDLMQENPYVKLEIVKMENILEEFG